MLNAEQKLALIADMCQHPGAYHWPDMKLAQAISRVVSDEPPIPYRLSEMDEPINYELAHDAVYEEVEDST